LTGIWTAGDPLGQTDKYGHAIEDREYNDSDFDRNLILEQRTILVAAKITEFLKATDRFAKTIVFCENIDHAERMRQALVNANADLAAANSRYVMRITGDNDEGKAQLDNFIDPESTFPVIAVTSQLMSTGVDAQTCHLIVLDKRIKSMTEFKQIIGRGTRINEDYNKLYFTIMDFGGPRRSSPTRTSTAIPCRSTSQVPVSPLSRPTMIRNQEKMGSAARTMPIPSGTGKTRPAPAPPATTWTTSRSASSPSASSIWMRTAGSSPNRSGIIRARPCARPTPP
jgi:type I site-specific restriction endonuclease